MPESDEEDESGEAGRKYFPHPLVLWISLVYFILLTTRAFPYEDSSPKALLAVTGPLTVFLVAATLVRHYWAQHKDRPGRGSDGD